MNSEAESGYSGTHVARSVVGMHLLLVLHKHGTCLSRGCCEFEEIFHAKLDFILDQSSIFRRLMTPLALGELAVSYMLTSMALAPGTPIVFSRNLQGPEDFHRSPGPGDEPMRHR